MRRKIAWINMLTLNKGMVGQRKGQSCKLLNRSSNEISHWSKHTKFLVNRLERARVDKREINNPPNVCKSTKHIAPIKNKYFLMSVQGHKLNNLSRAFIRLSQTVASNSPFLLSLTIRYLTSLPKFIFNVKQFVIYCLTYIILSTNFIKW